MPTVKTIGQFRFFFSSSDGSEPPHIHVQHERRVAKFWLNPVKLAEGGRIAGHELRQIERAVAQYRLEFLEARYDYFGH